MPELRAQRDALGVLPFGPWDASKAKAEDEPRPLEIGAPERAEQDPPGQHRRGDRSANPSPSPLPEESPLAERAYCALLHGPDDHFFVCALMLGHSLSQFSGSSISRILLCTGRWWEDVAARSALARLWTVQHVELVEAPWKTTPWRHRHVFTKIQALRLPVRRLVFLDLDIVVRADLAPLFEVPAPAGLYHGPCQAGKLVHGELIRVGGSWCVNAGVMRLDPRRTERERRQEVDEMLEDVRQIRRRCQLPEQWYLAQRLQGWRHIDLSWNMEVGSAYHAPDFTWPRAAAREAASAERERGELWCRQAVEDVHVFHFSGQQHQPWWWADHSPQAAFDDAAARWRHRDPRRLVAAALREWCRALELLKEEVASWPPFEREPAEAAVQRIAEGAAAYWAEARRPNERPMECRRCRGRFPEEEGRWLLGWEGWWVCDDCVVGYINSDEQTPEAPGCWACGRGGRGSWQWHRGWPWWTCRSCR